MSSKGDHVRALLKLAKGSPNPAVREDALRRSMAVMKDMLAEMRYKLDNTPDELLPPIDGE